MANDSRLISAEQEKDLLETLASRFEKNGKFHRHIQWEPVLAKLKARPEKLRSLYEMEATGGEPDVVGYDAGAKEYIFFDCSAESPKGRRSLCYDGEALAGRKENRPRDTAVDMAADMGTEILTEAQYRELQQLGTFDLKTSSWVKTPETVRRLGGALFCDRRYDTVFVYHNGAESYYAARGFRAVLRV